MLFFTCTLPVILYEYPLNERIRTYLRLGHLFGRLEQLTLRDGALDHHFALTTLFEVLEATSRADLKSDVLRDIEKQKKNIASWRGNPAISESTLDAVLAQLQESFDHLSGQRVKPGSDVLAHEWLMSVRSRNAIPGGTCEFDVPVYHAWQQGSAEQRRADLQQWTASLAPLAHAVNLLLRLLRDSGQPQKVIATGGHFQQMLPQGSAFQLLRLSTDEASGLVPEISANRMMVAIRLLRPQPDGSLVQVHEDATLELALCA